MLKVGTGPGRGVFNTGQEDACGSGPLEVQAAWSRIGLQLLCRALSGHHTKRGMWGSQGVANGVNWLGCAGMVCMQNYEDVEYDMCLIGGRAN